MLKRKIGIIVTGPPGCGKTTLAGLIVGSVVGQIATLAAIKESTADVLIFDDADEGDCFGNLRLAGRDVWRLSYCPTKQEMCE